MGFVAIQGAVVLVLSPFRHNAIMWLVYSVPASVLIVMALNSTRRR